MKFVSGPIGTPMQKGEICFLLSAQIANQVYQATVVKMNSKERQTKKTLAKMPNTSRLFTSIVTVLGLITYCSSEYEFAKTNITSFKNGSKCTVSLKYFSKWLKFNNIKTFYFSNIINNILS